MPLRIHLVQLLSPGRNSQRILCRLHSAPRETSQSSTNRIGQTMWGKLPNLQARALDILGATGRDSVERFDSRGESRPASVEDRFSGVEASILGAWRGEAVGDAPRMRVGGKTWRGRRWEKSGETESSWVRGFARRRPRQRHLLQWKTLLDPCCVCLLTMDSQIVI